MNFHILTPEFQNYAIVILFTWCLGSSNLASHVYSRYFFHVNVNPLFIQCSVKGLICFLAMIFFPIKNLFSSTISWQLASIPVGFSMGWFVIGIELKINRFLQRRKSQATYQPAQQKHYYFYTGPKKMIQSLSSTYYANQKTYLKKLHENYVTHESKPYKFSLMIVLLIAVFEEILFRGYLVQCCDLFPDMLTKFVLFMSVIIFGASHASFGLGQVLSKTMMGICCMVTVLTFHTLLPALIIHGYLNWKAFQCQQR
ncbi:MAG: hypothetical protein K0S27_539 [Gammaproteobacteria bacterium]|nr:hypothetical protein [Gammaproteobacteria bacterium]